MNATNFAFVGGITAVTVALLILALGFLTRKPPVIKPKPPKKDEDYWPNYEPTERKTNPK